jgi:multidrug efflux pump subunit AcrA (membrane-fusion protein)
MIRKVVLPIAAALGVFFAIFMVFYTTMEKPVPPIPYAPPKPPYTYFVAGAGLTEANSDNIAIGAPFTALTLDVYVQAGDLVKQGAPLFKIDDRVLQAQLKEAESKKIVALANFDKLLSEPRPESVPPFIAKVKQAEVNLEDQLMQYNLYESVKDKEAISVNELNQRRFAPALARASVGISMGKIGSATAVEASDVVFLQDDFSLLPWLIGKSHKTLSIVKQNLTLALIVILFATTPALLGFIPLWLAVILHEGGTVIVGLNSLRLLKKT